MARAVVERRKASCPFTGAEPHPMVRRIKDQRLPAFRFLYFFVARVE